MMINSSWKAALFTGISFAVLYSVLISAVIVLRIPLTGHIITSHLYTSIVMWLSGWRIYDYSISTFFLIGLIEGVFMHLKAREYPKKFVMLLLIAFIITFAGITLIGFLLKIYIGYVGP